MSNVEPSMRLKVKKGTFFMPESNESVYFRNNSGSFRMEGRTIHQWVENLIPMLNGEYSLASLTDGLPQPHCDRVYEIAGALYKNGFLRDVTKDLPHDLTEEVVKTYASQIEYLESFGNSAAFRFQQYRQHKVLVIGEGPMFVSLVSALLHSGLNTFHTFITDPEKTSRQRLLKIEAVARNEDPDVAIEWLWKQNKETISWEKQVEAFDSILYVSSEGKIKELRNVLKACTEKKKLFFPAVCLGDTGFAGPMISPGSRGCWESAWRSIPRNLIHKNHRPHSFSSTAGAMLTNTVVFELFKKITGVKETHHNHHMFLLNLETLEGRWHPFKLHPLEKGKLKAKRVENVLNQSNKKEKQIDRNELIYYFADLAAGQLGIFHVWDEGDLNQLPLSQCKIQVADVRSKGPATLHPSIVKTAMTHQDARREAGLSGIEQYVNPLKNEIGASLESPLNQSQNQHVNLHIGAGETLIEAASRALHKAVKEKWEKQADQSIGTLKRVDLKKIEDDHCRYYWQVLSTMNKVPELAIGKDTYGFPVIWVKTEEHPWKGCVGFNRTLALRDALLFSLTEAQNQTTLTIDLHGSFSNLSIEETPVQSIDIPACCSEEQTNILRSALQLLQENNQKFCFIKVLLDTFEKDRKVDIYGVWLEEEERK